MFGVALDRDDIDGFRFMRMNINRKSEVGRQIAADLVPGFAGIVAAHDVPVLLHEQHVRARRMHGDAMDAVANFRSPGRELVKGFQPAIDRAPRLAAVVGAENARGRDGDEDSLGLARIQQDRVQTHAARTRLPEMSLGAAQPGQFLPVAAAVCGLEQGGVFCSGINGVRIGQRRLEMPDAFEFPGMLSAVVPLMSAGNALVVEFVADCLPGLAAIDQSAESSDRTSRWICDA